MVAAKYAVLLLLSILFCISSTAASILCGSIFFDVTNIIYKLLFSVLDGIMIALSALPLVLLIVFFSKTYIFSIMLCVFYSVFNLLSTFTITSMPRILVFLLPTPSIMLWSSRQIAEHMSMEDAADLQNFVELGLIPSTAQSVSYTHLDVYKRQVLSGLRIIQRTLSLRWMKKTSFLVSLRPRISSRWLMTRWARITPN